MYCDECPSYVFVVGRVSNCYLAKLYQLRHTNPKYTPAYLTHCLCVLPWEYAHLATWVPWVRYDMRIYYTRGSSEVIYVYKTLILRKASDHPSAQKWSFDCMWWLSGSLPIVIWRYFQQKMYLPVQSTNKNRWQWNRDYNHHLFMLQCAYQLINITSTISQKSSLSVVMVLVNIQNVQRALDTLRPRQNGSQIPDDNFKCIFLNENT